MYPPPCGCSPGTYPSIDRIAGRMKLGTEASARGLVISAGPYRARRAPPMHAPPSGIFGGGAAVECGGAAAAFGWEGGRGKEGQSPALLVMPPPSHTTRPKAAAPPPHSKAPQAARCAGGTPKFAPARRARYGTQM